MPSYVIVGASRGLGYEWLRALQARDASNVVIGTVRSVSSTKAKLEADKISTSNIHVVPADLASFPSLQSAAEETAAILSGSGISGLDYLIVNGAYLSEVAPFTPITEYDTAEKAASLEEESLKSMQANFVGPVLAVNAFLPLLRKGTVKKIVVISTGLADVEGKESGAGPAIGIPYFVPYSASKAAANLVAAKFAVALKPEGFVVLALSPGVVNTSEGKEAPTEDFMVAFGGMLKTLQQHSSPGFQGPISPEESVQAQLKVIESKGVKDTGGFVSHFGNQIWA